jgi:uncharacterized protein
VTVLVLSIVVLLIACLMTMTGRGGGNFYMLALVLSGYQMGIAASTAQFVLMCSAVAAALLFKKRRMTDWKLTAFIGGLVFVSALCGGFIGQYFDESVLRILFALCMIIAAAFMLKKPVQKRLGKCKGTLSIASQKGTWHIYLPTTIPAILLIGALSGMTGVSGGSFLVPLMLLAMNIPMHIAVVVSTMLVAISAGAGFLGHLGAGVFDISLAGPLAVGGIIGGVIGARITLRTKPAKLKYLFAGTQLLAAVSIIIRTISSLLF